MREPFVHQAVLALGADSDARAPGGAVTVALCGHWEHEGLCRWPHLTTTGARVGSTVTVRTVFAAVPEEEDAVRRQVASALRSGALDAPDGHSSWTVVSQGPGPVQDADHQWAARQQPPADG